MRVDHIEIWNGSKTHSKLNLPDSIRVSPGFSPDNLRLAASTPPLPGQHPDPPSPEQVHDENEWEVEDILDSRIHYRKLQYRVHCAGMTILHIIRQLTSRMHLKRYGISSASIHISLDPRYACSSGLTPPPFETSFWMIILTITKPFARLGIRWYLKRGVM